MKHLTNAYDVEFALDYVNSTFTTSDFHSILRAEYGEVSYNGDVGLLCTHKIMREFENAGYVRRLPKPDESGEFNINHTYEITR